MGAQWGAQWGKSLVCGRKARAVLCSPPSPPRSSPCLTLPYGQSPSAGCYERGSQIVMPTGQQGRKVRLPRCTQDRGVGPGPRSGPVGMEGHLCEEGSMVCIQQELSKGAAYLWPPRGSSRSWFLSHPVKEQVPPTGPRAPPRSHWHTVRWAVPWVLLWPLQLPGPAKGRTYSFVHSFIHSPCLPSSVGKCPSGTPTSPLEFSLPGWHKLGAVLGRCANWHLIDY